MLEDVLNSEHAILTWPYRLLSLILLVHCDITFACSSVVISHELPMPNYWLPFSASSFAFFGTPTMYGTETALSRWKACNTC